MTTILSTQTGNWNAGSTWVGGVPPGANDIASIEVGDDVTVSAAQQGMKIIVNGGHLTFNADFIWTDSPYASLAISADSTSSVTSNGTAASPRILKSESNNPTNPWYITVNAVAGFDSRVLNFDYIEMRGNRWSLGYAPSGGGNWVGILFNNPNITTSSWLLTVQPIARDPVLIEHTIDGRSTSRVYQRGSHAGAVSITGYMPLASWDYLTVRLLQESNQRLALFTNRHHFPKLRFDGKPRFDPKPGHLFVPFSMTLIEDQ